MSYSYILLYENWALLKFTVNDMNQVDEKSTFV